jgi:hypothetical protein
VALVVHGFGETSRYNGGITFEIPLYQTLGYGWVRHEDGGRGVFSDSLLVSGVDGSISSGLLLCGTQCRFLE